MLLSSIRSKVVHCHSHTLIHEVWEREQESTLTLSRDMTQKSSLAGWLWLWGSTYLETGVGGDLLEDALSSSLTWLLADLCLHWLLSEGLSDCYMGLSVGLFHTAASSWSPPEQLILKRERKRGRGRGRGKNYSVF